MQLNFEKNYHMRDFNIFFKFIFIFFYTWLHLYGYCILHIPTPASPFFPFSLSSRFPFHYFLPTRAPPPPPENVIAAIISYAVSHLHEGTWKLRKTYADTVGYLQSLSPVYSLWKKNSRSAFRYAGRGPAVAHRSTDPAPSYLTWLIA